MCHPIDRKLPLGGLIQICMKHQVDTKGYGEGYIFKANDRDVTGVPSVLRELWGIHITKESKYGTLFRRGMYLAIIRPQKFSAKTSYIIDATFAMLFAPDFGAKLQGYVGCI